MSKKNAILDSATKLFIRNGYEKTSIDDITKSCGITKGAFYYHFKNKDEIFLHIVDIILNELEVWIDKKTESVNGAKELIESFFYLEDYYSYSDYYDNYDTYIYNILFDMVNLYPEIKEKISHTLFSKLDDMVSVLEAALENNEIRQGFDLRSFSLLIIYSVEGMLFVSAMSSGKDDLIHKSKKIGDDLWCMIKA